jgi:hypothetical protein
MYKDWGILSEGPSRASDLDALSSRGQVYQSLIMTQRCGPDIRNFATPHDKTLYWSTRGIMWLRILSEEYIRIDTINKVL